MTDAESRVVTRELSLALATQCLRKPQGRFLPVTQPGWDEVRALAVEIEGFINAARWAPEKKAEEPKRLTPETLTAKEPAQPVAKPAPKPARKPTKPARRR